MSTNTIDGKFEKHGATVVRLALGAILLAHGVFKVLNFPPTLAYFGTLGLPPELAYVVAALELVGGLLLIAGIQTRWAAVAVLPVLLGATWVHLGNGWLFSSTGGGWEYPLLLVLLAVVEALVGDRGISLSGGLRFSRPRSELAA